VSRRYQSILIGGLIGGALGALAGWFFSTAAERKADDFAFKRPAGSGLQFQGDSGDLLKFGLAVIPIVRLLTNMFVPAGAADKLPTEKPER